MNMIVTKLWKIHKTERLDTYIKYIFLKKRRCRRFLQNLSQKKRKIFDSRTKRYRIIGHIRCRPKNLAIYFKRQYWKLLLRRTVPCLHVVRLNRTFTQESPLASYQYNNRKSFQFTQSYKLPIYCYIYYIYIFTVFTIFYMLNFQPG